MALACVLLLDLARRARDLSAWYSNDGLLPNHALLWRPPFEWQFSFFFVASTPLEATAGMVACAIAYTFLLAGYRTKLAQIASLVCVLSLHTRTTFVGNGGDFVLGELTLWTAFLPTGRRYSLDALVERHRRARGLGSTHEQPEPAAPVVSFAVLGLTLQLACIYLFNALSKTGTTWREGSVVHYMLFHSGIVTPLGEWARGLVTLRESQVLTYAALAIEALLPFLLLLPVARRAARRLAVAAIVVLHGGFGLFLNLGVFVPVMIAFGLHFVPGADWDALACFVRRRAPRSVAEIGGRVDGLAQRLARATPVEPSKTVRGVLGRVGVAREVVAGSLVLLLITRVLIDNRAVTKLDIEHEPAFVRALTSYLQFVQSWSMYAPDADKIDVNVYVDAVTADGHHVDPFNGWASPAAPKPGPVIPPRLDQSNLSCAYALRIAGAPAYHRAFTEWIQRYPERTGRAEDRIVSFRAFLVTDEAPPPGGHQPTNTNVRQFLAYP